MQSTLIHKKAAFGSGSFWTDNLDDESTGKLKLVGGAALTTRANSVFHKGYERLRFDTRRHRVENLEITGAEYTAVQKNGKTWYRMDVGLDHKPFRIQADKKVLWLGADFFADLDWPECYVFLPFKPEHPVVIVLEGSPVEKGTSLINLLLGTPDSLDNDGSVFAADYLRGKQNPADFENAVRAAAGLKHTNYPFQELFDRKEENGVTTYFFGREKIVVPYSHDPPETGKRYGKNTWLGSERVRMLAYDGSDDWYRPTGHDWTEHGLDVGEITGVSPLVAPDETRTVTDENGQARFALSGDNETFWEKVSAREGDHGGGIEQKYPVGTSVNPLDVFFRDFLDHVLLLLIDAEAVGAETAVGVRNWAVRNTLSGYLLVVRVKWDGTWSGFDDFADRLDRLLVKHNLIYGDFDSLLYYRRIPVIYAGHEDGISVNGLPVTINGIPLIFNN